MAMFDFKLTEKRSTLLHHLQLTSSFDIVSYFPARYDDFSVTKIERSSHQQRVVIKGEVHNKGSLIRINTRFQRFQFEVKTLDSMYRVVVFNRPYLLSNLVINSPVLIAGKLDYYKKEIIATDVITKQVDSFFIRPRYRLPQDYTQYDFQQLVKKAYSTCVQKNQLREIIPVKYRTRYRLWPRNQAYFAMHFPQNSEQVHQALRYLKYEELLIFSLMMQKMKAFNQTLQKRKEKVIDESYLDRLIAQLPFSLSQSQIQALSDIKEDMQSNRLMYRLLQGDVGSGKTIVALLALAMNFRAGFQGALMAPTEILANQHYQTLTRFFAFDPTLRIRLLTAAISIKEKEKIYREIEEGTIHIVIGTHALIQEKLAFTNLGLAIIDEQHRFGVAQRKLLREKGEQVELMMMSATPIPRTLAISLFGDMDVSTLQSLPTAQRQVETLILADQDFDQLAEAIAQQTQQQHAVFVVCPLIEEGQSRRSVTEVYQGLQEKLGKAAKISMLHGKMKALEKEKIMESFRSGKIDVLVATTVIEVGVDIQHANMIVIFNAESFGLAQLHQLRGRIGRRGQSGYCYLVVDNEGEETKQRLTYFANHHDGFDIARYDLASRGQGDIAGVRQSGVYDFQVASIFEDLKILEIAREDAKEIIQNPTNHENQQIIDFVDTMMAKTIAIID